MKELNAQFQELLANVRKTAGLLNMDAMKARLVQIEVLMNEANFWSRPESAKKISQEFDDIKKELETWETLEGEITDTIELIELAQKDSDEHLKTDLEHTYNVLLEKFKKLEFYILLHDAYDHRNALVAIHAGAGGVDAQDWAAMLLRMFLRFCERKGWKVNMIDKAVGGEAGLKRAVFEITGRYAYGYLQSENGVHRLVRISPFDSEGMRHTSFALVEVLPEFEDIDSVDIKDADLRIDVFRSGGHGGQSVNTTDSAVRIVHIPTGITVVCQNERSQLQNKATAMKYLKAKLHKLQIEEQQAQKQKIRGEFASAEWGSQIRSYVLHPYKLVKDHRTKFETKDPGAVLEGNLDAFIESYLRWKRDQKKG